VSVRPGHSAVGEVIPQSSPNPVSRGGCNLDRPASAPSRVGGAMFRVTHRGEGLDDTDTLEGARGIVRGQSPGRYDVDESGASRSPRATRRAR
jgi:hypothetical protein